MKTKIILLAVILIAGCHCEKKTTETKPVDIPKMQPVAGDDIQPLNNLVVSFYSTGSGINYKAVLELEKFMSNYSESTKTPIHYKKIPWGREGEVDYCIELSAWDINAKAKFISQVKEKLSGVQVHINENYPCRQLK